MFESRKKKEPANVLEEIIFAFYGNPPPPKRAKLEEAITMASDELLMGLIDIQEVRKHAEGLNSTPMPYSTHDLALAVALHFFKQPEYMPCLESAQIMARLQAVQWLEKGLVVSMLVEAFENVLYRLYKPAH